MEIIIGDKPENGGEIPPGFVLIKTNDPSVRRGLLRAINDSNNSREPSKAPGLDELTKDSGEIPGLMFLM